MSDGGLNLDEEDRERQRQAFIGQRPLSPLLGDAGMRRYFRCDRGILLDCPPALGGVASFIHYSELFQELPVPKVIGYDLEQGFALLEDFGDRWLLEDLQLNPDKFMAKALALLGRWQQTTVPLQPQLKPYDETVLEEEIQRFRQWFLPYVKLDISLFDRLKLTSELNYLSQHMAKFQRVCVHRDYHSRNLMVLAKELPRAPEGLGILDYQDTLLGCPSYDLISITRDCYISYGRPQVEAWEEQFRAAHHPDFSPTVWAELCNVSALQRHLKVLGGFVRLAQRDQKPAYLQHLPLVLHYARDEAQRLELHIISKYLEKAQLPHG